MKDIQGGFDALTEMRDSLLRIEKLMESYDLGSTLNYMNILLQILTYGVSPLIIILLCFVIYQKIHKHHHERIEQRERINSEDNRSYLQMINT